MPSNHILINNSMEYFVPDSKMDEFMEWLDSKGEVADTGLRRTPDENQKEAGL